MKVTHSLAVEAEIPFISITNLDFRWCLDEHAVLHIAGFLDNLDTETIIFKSYTGTAITVKYENDTLFCGNVKDTRLNSEGGLYQMIVNAVSASDELDREPRNEMFQDCSATYKDMMRSLTAESSGDAICTIGDEALGFPQLCYQETIWQYARRMASHFHSYVVADIKTDRPVFWFGLRPGKSIEDHGLLCEQIEIRKPVGKHAGDGVFCTMEGRGNYQLCDYLFVEGKWQTIYEKAARLERGEVIFSYQVAGAEYLSKGICYPVNQTGLSLGGTIERTEGEQVYIRLDIDGKPGMYPFLWLPETGNGLYAMPEAGARAEIYFMGKKSRDVIAVRCRSGKEDDDSENKKSLKCSETKAITMSMSNINIKGKSEMDLWDHRINVFGAQSIEISAKGKIAMAARIIEMNAADTINYVTE